MNKGYVQSQSNNAWRFFVFSFIGILCFFVPIEIAGTSSIIVDHVHLAIRALFGGLMPYIALIMILAGAILPLIRKSYKNSFADFVIVVFKVLGAIIGVMYVFHFGPALLFKKDYGPFLFEQLMMPLSVLIPVGAIALSLLVSYGLLEFVGVFMEPVMRPIFKTPGKSAVDAVASFVGSYSLGLLITNRVYKEGLYNKREATIIATGFSTVSATFMIIVANTLGLMPHWNLYFWGTLVITFIVTAITAWLPPIVNESTEYYNGQEGEPEVEIVGSRLKTAYAEALKKNAATPSLAKNVWDNLRDGLEMTIAILPSILSIGFLGLILANFTPVIDWLSYIFYPFIYIFPTPDQALLAKASAISIIEMFLPSLLVAKAALSTKFIVGVVSVSAIIFFSALVPCIMATEIKIPIWKLVVIWFLRVVLTLLITIPLGLWIF
ncbi:MULTISPECIES: YjiH family protein [Staphylococcus]|jgi:nucleoside recognition membrane protein YjiH|uniref:YjiH family protein n=1 Tax=Staphylococcus gallinarum TaxID=1293 RepID=A0A2T4SUT2_STAGA|nr:YjiH family protein [Staphylococcus gallinarum]MBU7217705.1 YjiH family protein [Staphylococcus gallinarum]MCD8820468.1 YjiH family protein [Staphylococcus gallinarum]MCD8918933.1 YjiH family protein [Staphylococcus gallinarum]PTE35493.1 histidine transporter [Staphylococcus gallinarum]PTK92763.1 histidine transporter [Staphylococcus gallinarum]